MAKSIRVRWFSVILYPDNPVHMRLFDYWVNSGQQGIYIKHDPDAVQTPDGGIKGCTKEHYHCMLYFENPRTAKGLQESFGKCNAVKEGDALRAVLDTTGYDAKSIVSTWVISPALCTAVSDVRSYGMYFLHKNFECMMLGKKEYPLSDIKSIQPHDYEIVNRVFEGETVTATGGECYEIMDLIKTYRLRNLGDLMSQLFISHRSDLIKYVEKHTYLIKNLF